MNPLRIVFMGTAELACPVLQALCTHSDFAVATVVTQPDKPKGRELKLQPPPVKVAALANALPVLQPARARDPAFVETLAGSKPELIVVVAYGQILPQSVLELPRYGCLNVHTSILPKYRGAAPIQWAILNGDPETGVTIMKMDAGLDTGEIVSVITTPITAEDNAPTLHNRLARLGADLLIRTIPEYVAGQVTPRPQPSEGATYARKITKEDGRIDWSRPARAIWNQVRAFMPWPGAFTGETTAKESGRLLKIWEATVEASMPGDPGTVLRADKGGIVVACGEQSLRILQLQREGGRRLGAGEFLAGHSLRAGEHI